MISITQLAARFETALNALRAEGEEWEFKIWANAGKYRKPRRQGNKVYYTLNGNLSTTTTAIEANVLVMGVNGLSLEFLVPSEPPRTNAQQTDAQLAKIQDGQFYFVSRITQILTEYFTGSKAFTMEDENGETFGCSMVGGVAVPQDIDLRAAAGESIPLRVSITLNFVLGGINALNVKLYMDGERVPYMSFIPSRATTLNTDVQSNDVEQKSIATSSVYGIEFTCPSSVSNPATSEAYNFIADAAEVNTAHFITVEWGSQRTDAYLMFITDANVTAQGADFTGLHVTMAKVYGNEEYFKYPSTYGVHKLTAADSQAKSVSFSIAAIPADRSSKTVDMPIHCAGRTRIITLTRDSDPAAIMYRSPKLTFSLTAEDYSYNADEDTYDVYLIVPQFGNLLVDDLSEGFTDSLLYP